VVSFGRTIRHGLFVAALGLGAVTTAYSQHPAGQQHDQQTGSAIQAGAQRNAQARVPTSKAEAKDATPYKPRCDAPRDREEASYCEDAKARQAADDANDLSFAALILSVIGTGALIVTLWFTIKAANAAKEAAVAAHAAVDLGRDTAKRQLRAYVNIGTLRTRLVEGGVPKVDFVLKNTGQTPARRLLLRVVAITTHDHPSERITMLGEAIVPEYEIASGQPSDQDVSIGGGPLTKGQVTAYREGRWTILVAGYIRYYDVFGVTRRTVFRAYGLPEPEEDGFYRFAVADKHVRTS